MKRFLAVLMSILFLAGCFSCSAPSAPHQSASADDPVVAIPTSIPLPPASAAPGTAEPGTAAPAETPEPTQEASAEPTGSAEPFETPGPTETASADPTSSAEPSGTPAPSGSPAPSASPSTSTPAPTSQPIDTPAPTATPEPVVSGDISFSESPSLPLPSTNEDIPHGQPFCFGGKVTSSKPIVSVRSLITTAGGAAVIDQAVTFPASENKLSVELVDRTFPASGNQSLTAKVKFESLSVGTYYFYLYATVNGGSETRLVKHQFKIVKHEWNQLIPNNLRNNYAYALSFFGSRDQFMFRYKWADNRNITVESSWISEHFTSVTSPMNPNKQWYCHKLAAPHFTEAFNYIKTSRIRVHGAHDSGIIPLSELLVSFDGLFNTRFVTDRTFVSHHSFGTALDLNATMQVNKNRIENRELIRTEVQNHLTYNGIKEQNGVKYYDFTYDGSCSELYHGVPATVINYLLYELAFYRAGFGWGYYYVHACDGMHFTVSEMDPNIHNTSSRSLRKVYSYIG